MVEEKNTKIENEKSIIVYESDNSNNLDIPVVSSFATTSGSETELYIDITGNGEFETETVKLIEIRN